MSLSVPRSRLHLRAGLSLFVSLLVLAGCGGGDGGAASAPVETAPAFQVGGTLTGLRAGASLTLLNNGTDPLALTADGAFAFGAPVTGRYDVTVGTPPLWHACAVARGAGTALADVADVDVTCTQRVITGTVATGIGGAAGVAVDRAGNAYVTDWNASRLLRVGPGGVVTILASTTEGLDRPMGVAVARDGTVYLANSYAHNILRVAPGGAVTVLAGSVTDVAGGTDGAGTAATFNTPYGIAIDRNGDLYVSDFLGHRVRKVTQAGVVTTLAGDGTAAFADGTGAAARFNHPVGVAMDAAGNVLVADSMNHRIRRITPAGVATTVAGTGIQGGTDGPAATATFAQPFDVAVAPDGDLYVADFFAHRLRRIARAGEVSTFAGSSAGTPGAADGDAATARFANPAGLAFDSAGNLFVADYTNQRLRKLGP